MTNVEISKIKNKIYGKLNSLTLEDCIKKIDDPNYNLELCAVDLKYNIKLNKNSNNTERI